MKRIVTAALLVWSTGPVVGASPAEIEERIQRVQRGIVPPVLVSGESPLMRSLAERMSEVKVPGVSIAVIHDGRIEWARGFGVTHGGGAPVTDNTLFQAASISKPVFALGVLRLVDAGKLNLDANVNDYLKTWKLPENDLTRQSRVTLRGILSHTAGLTVHGFPGYAAKAASADDAAGSRGHAAREHRRDSRRHAAGIAISIFRRWLRARTTAVVRCGGHSAAQTHARFGTRAARHEPQHL